MLDREFFMVGNISVLNRMSVNYLMPCRSTPGVVETLTGFVGSPSKNVTRCNIREAGGSAPHNMVVTERRNCNKNATSHPWIGVACYSSRWGVEIGYAKVG